MDDEDEFLAGVLARTKAAREGSHGRKWKPDDIAEELGTDVDAYRKYETRSPLPHRHMLRFCRLTGISLEELLGGKPKGRQGIPVAPVDAVQETAPKKPKPRRRAP